MGPRFRHSRRLVRGLALVAGAMSLVGAAACGGPAPAAGDASKGEASGTIRLLTPIFDGTDGESVLDKLLATFTKAHPKVKVEVDRTTYDKLNEKLATSVASGRPYDVMMMGVGWVPPFADKGVLADLGRSPSDLSKTYARRVVDAGVYKGKVYALPVMLDTRFGVYRKDMFAEAGISGPPTTFAELRADARKLTVRDAKGKLTRAGIDILSVDARQGFETLLWAAGGQLFNDDYSKPTFNSPEGVKALQLLTDLVRTDKAIDIGFAGGDTSGNPLIQGRAAMAIGHNNLWLDIQDQAPDLASKLGTFVLTDERPAMFQGGTLVTMSARTQHKPAAMALVNYLAGADASLAASEQRGNVPAVKALSSSDYVKNDAFVRFAMANMDNAYSEGGVPAWLDIREDFAGAVEAALLGKKTPQQALDDLADKASAAMQR